MKYRKEYKYGIIAGLFLLVLDFIFFRGTRYFVPLIVISVTIGWAQVWIDFFLESQRRKEYEARFLDFVRNLVGAIKSGMPVPKAIIHVSNESDFGSLNPHLKKLANQLEWSIPVHRALKIFSSETGNEVIERAVSTVIEAEQAGGNMEDVLESITVSLVEIKKLRDQRRASIHSQLLQSYVIFFVFLGIMVVIQNLLVPYLGKMAGANIATGDVGTGEFIGLAETSGLDFTNIFTLVSSIKLWFLSLSGIFLSLALIQGFFAGIIIGKMSEGELVIGLKHSLILMTIAFIVISFAQGG